MGALKKLTGWAQRKPASRNSHGLNRARYYVLAGDTLEKIAENSMGDTRFVGLLVTINRPMVKMMGDGSSRIPYIQPGTSIFLPTQEEQEVYRANFMARETPVKHQPEKSEIEAVKIPKGVFAESATAFDDEAPAPKIIFDREEVTKKAAAEILAQCEPEMEEREVEIFEPDELVDTIGAVVQLSDCCRVLINESTSNVDEFQIKLEAAIMSNWTTIAAYYSQNNRIARVMYRTDGRRKQIDMQLPASVVKEMAEEDFMHNWQRHYRGYMMQQPSSIWLEFPARTI
ncbi:MAG: hypothetical protein C0507_05020 [Cyanobacteria bacterium PR.3.49]|jgi:hypothetical protein|nr:hypothetical protein [Cyanobacteria bacterium PR.3.49]